VLVLCLWPLPPSMENADRVLAAAARESCSDALKDSKAGPGASSARGSRVCAAGLPRGDGRRSAVSGAALRLLLPTAAALACVSIPVKDLRAAVVQLTTCARETLGAGLMCRASLLLRHAYASNACIT